MFLVVTCRLSSNFPGQSILHSFRHAITRHAHHDLDSCGNRESISMHVVVVVLGDLGRSPRMEYHCQSLLDAGHNVSFVGYDGEALIDTLVEQEGKRLRVIRFHVPTLQVFANRNKLLYFAWRMVSLSLFLAHALLFSVESSKPVDFVLVQNPPALPLLAVVYLYCRIKQFLQRRRPGFIIDWHNLGYSMLTDGSSFQKIARIYEQKMAPLADGHLTVTKAMEEFLAREMAITNNVDVLYDCPPDMFEPLDAQAQHDILTKLDKLFCKVCPRSWWEAKTEKQTLFTEQMDESEQKVPKSFRHRPNRPALVTSSTSWTPDEDFGMLLAALQHLDKRIEIQEEASSSSLKVLVVVTGKGPEREMYQEKISQLQMQHVAIATVWLEPGDYPRLLACADLGVSLHTSTSGLDLPMKVLDLFGCEVPVVAHGFQCLPELVQDRVNGRIFTTSEQLTEILYELLHPLASSSSSNTGAVDSPVVLSNHSYGALDAYSKTLQGRDRWNANWMEHALPVILKAAHTR